MTVCQKLLNVQTEELSFKAAQSGLQIQNLGKQLALFRQYIEEVQTFQGHCDVKSRHKEINKDIFDKTNIQKKL